VVELEGWWVTDRMPGSPGCSCTRAGTPRVLLDGALTSGFDETGSLLIAASWIVGLTAAFVALFHHSVRAPLGPRPHLAGRRPDAVTDERA
jgi:hypothetical protein